MARKGRRQNLTSEEGGAFVETLKDALEHHDDFVWLGEKSPLAAPYFLGNLYDGLPGTDTPKGRGAALSQVLRNCVDSLSDSFERDLLVAYYFDPTITARRNRADALVDRFFRSRPQLLRDLKMARKNAAEALSRRAIPPLRGESPTSRVLVGRADLIEKATALLRNKQAVAFIGPGGQGKTAAAVRLAEQWDRTRVLWFTLRPGISDRLLSLAFSLAHFLHSLGANNTWRQLMADDGRVRDEALFAQLVRHDLDQIKALPLLCMDEMEVLRVEFAEHGRIRMFLEGLRDTLPMLFIGQRTIVQTQTPDNIFEVSGLNAENLTDWLTFEDIDDLSAADHAALIDATHGNPALIRLFLSLHRSGETVGHTIAQLGARPSTEALINRLWARLGTPERHMLAVLAVFDGFAPRDAWTEPGAQGMQDSLIERAMVEADMRGGVRVTPFAREFVVQRIAADDRAKLHRFAGAVIEERGDYTEAARHYVIGNAPELAVQLWAAHRDVELKRGQAAAALALFKQVPLDLLKKDNDKKVLAVILADLLMANGESAQAAELLESLDWAHLHELTPRARRMTADAYEQADMLERAEQEYRNVLESLPYNAEDARVQVMRNLSHLQGYRLGDWPRARRIGSLAYVEASIMMGNIEEQDGGDFAKARMHYQNAIALAEALPDAAPQLHDCLMQLGRLNWKSGDAAAGAAQLENALVMARELRWTARVAMDQLNLSAVHIVLGDHAKALAAAQDGLAQSKSASISQYTLGGLNSNAGEACYYLGRYDDALHYAQASIQLEEQAHIPYAMMVLGMTYRVQGDFAKAGPALNDALKLCRGARDVYGEASALRGLGDLYVDQCRLADARAAYSDSAALFRKLDNNSSDAAGVDEKLAGLSAIS